MCTVHSSSRGQATSQYLKLLEKKDFRDIGGLARLATLQRLLELGLREVAICRADTEETIWGWEISKGMYQVGVLANKCIRGKLFEDSWCEPIVFSNATN